MCSATGSGHVITCTARRWVVSGRLYCFQRPPAEGRREACKLSTDPTSRITNVRINRTAAHRSIFRPAFAEPPCCTQSTAAASRHRQDEKSCSFFQPSIRQIGSTYRKYAIAALPSAGRKILPKEWRVSFSLHRRASSWQKSSQFSGSTGGASSLAERKILPKEWRVSFSLHRRASSWRKIQSIFRLNRRRLVIGRTKNYSSSSDRICSINRS